MRAAKRSAVAGRCGGELKFSKVIRAGFPPSASTTSSIFWSAKDRGETEGGKTAANLAAILCRAVTLQSSF